MLMEARLLSKKPCSVTFSSHSCLRTEEIKQAWVFLEGKLCLSLLARVRWCVCNAGRNGRKSSSLCPPGVRGESSNWPLPETTLFQVWKPQRRLYLQNPNMTPFLLCFWNMAMTHFLSNYSVSRNFCSVNNGFAIMQLDAWYCYIRGS